MTRPATLHLCYVRNGTLRKSFLAGSWLFAMCNLPTGHESLLLAAMPLERSELSPMQQDLLAKGIYNRLALTNLECCPQTEPVTGMMLHDIASYNLAARPTIERRYALGNDLGVLAVVPGTAAERAGLLGGDRILSVGSTPTSTLYGNLIRKKASPARMEALELWLAKRLQEGAQKLAVQRQGTTVGITLVAPIGCAGHVQVEQAGGIDAWSDGRNSVIGADLLPYLTSDDEVAFVIAHEMSHNLLNQVAAIKGNLAAPKCLIKVIPLKISQESKADLIATIVLRNAGYRPEAGLNVLKKITILASKGNTSREQKMKRRQVYLQGILAAGEKNNDRQEKRPPEN